MKGPAHLQGEIIWKLRKIHRRNLKIVFSRHLQGVIIRKLRKIHRRNLKIVFSRIIGSISTKLCTKHSWMIVCLGGYVPLDFFTHMETSPLLVKGCKFWPVLNTHCHWAVRVFFSVPHLLWHGASVCNGHLRGPVTLTSNAERLSVELSLPDLRFRSVAAGIRAPNLSLARRTL